MDTLPYIALFLAWTAPLLVFPLSNRCPAKQVEAWLGVLVLTSWIGLAVFVWRYYWTPELRKGSPENWRMVG